LAPLEDNVFNKSQVIESGFHKIIAQDFGPYQIDLVNAIQFGGGFNENGNAMIQIKTLVGMLLLRN
jgi:hypothetical protein